MFISLSAIYVLSLLGLHDKFAIQMSFQWTEWGMNGQSYKHFEVKIHVTVIIWKIQNLIVLCHLELLKVQKNYDLKSH